MQVLAEDRHKYVAGSNLFMGTFFYVLSQFTLIYTTIILNMMSYYGTIRDNKFIKKEKYNLELL